MQTHLEQREDQALRNLHPKKGTFFLDAQASRHVRHDGRPARYFKKEPSSVASQLLWEFVTICLWPEPGSRPGSGTSADHCQAARFANAGRPCPVRFASVPRPRANRHVCFQGSMSGALSCQGRLPQMISTGKCTPGRTRRHDRSSQPC